ncbi:RNA-directed DNA polymerase-like protein [Gossypium australe]|uniref:RNA-directed DNA polymerase-like protein n=1 Tax=Gossypium australe TaxID=47621 RepID=A0A5B6WEB0_9ROSI|nr:RNA-directed DNA polymerase-like protein [Gossypium australe]
MPNIVIACQAAATIMNPGVLPSEWWMPHTTFFNSSANYPFAAYLKSKPITIQIFPGCFVNTTVLGSKLPGKDIVININKRSEQIKGKLRLVVNYEPFNLFLQDDKFPLRNKKALFSSLAKAKVYSKFDLKAGFWQLGVILEDRPKTGFCIPNRHYQWKVMPFWTNNSTIQISKGHDQDFPSNHE